MPDKPKIDPYPEPVAMTAINLRRVNRKQAEKGRAERCNDWRGATATWPG